MAFWNFMLFSRKNDSKGVRVKRIKKQKSPGLGEMAAGNLTGASNTISQIMDQQSMPTKILVVQDGINSTILEDYAVKMAHKLDCEIVALDVSNEPMEHQGERRNREISRFIQRAQRSAETIQLKAAAMGVTCTHIVKIGDQEETIKALSQEDKCVRYVLTKPVQEQLGPNQRSARVPVFDLSCSRL
jgi:hypothetical protein